MASKLAQDVAETLEGVKREMQQLQERYPDEPLLLVHLSYNWRVFQLLKEAGSGLVLSVSSGVLPGQDDVSVFRGP